MAASIFWIEEAMRGKVAFLKATNPLGGKSDDGDDLDDWDDDDAPDGDELDDRILSVFRSLPNYRRDDG